MAAPVFGFGIKASSSERLFVTTALGPRDGTVSLTRTSGGLRTQLRGDSLSVGSGSAAITLTSTAQRGGAWTRHRSGATRKTRFGSQAVVFATGLAEEFFVVDRRLGRRTWQWRLEPGRWTPRIGVDGGVSFGAAGLSVRWRSSRRRSSTGAAAMSRRRAPAGPFAGSAVSGGSSSESSIRRCRSRT